MVANFEEVFMNFFSAIALVALCAGSMPAWAVNKCTSASGEVTFQQAPCADKIAPRPSVAQAPKPTASKPRPPMGDPAYEKARELERAKQIDSDAKVRGAALAADLEATEAKCGKGSLEPRVGSSADWIRKCSWGEPNSVKSIETALGKSEHWRYKAKGTLYFDASGKVTTILN